MTTERNIVIEIERLTPFNFGQALSEFEMYVGEMSFVDLAVQPLTITGNENISEQSDNIRFRLELMRTENEDAEMMWTHERGARREARKITLTRVSNTPSTDSTDSGG